jgi:dipeptidyl aminopeptidase/acylaminoacyl peptidase
MRLSLPAVAGVDPNFAHRGSLSPTGDRLALVGSSSGISVLMTAKVERDSLLRIIGLSDLVVVGDLYTIGIPDPKFPTEQGFTGYIDFSPDGRSIVASIYYDLWMIHLRDDNTYLSAERLTQTNGFAEWNAAFSPDGSHIAYVGGAINKDSGGVSSRDLDIYSLVPSTGAVTPVTTNSNKGGAARSRNNPNWSPDGARIAFTAYDNAGPPRGSTCSGLVNSDIYLIKADGSTTATRITNTNGTSVEAWTKWGW